MNTHIWETPLPEPSEGEYTLPASMKQRLFNTQGSTLNNEQQVAIDPNISHIQNPNPNAQPQYTLPVKVKQSNPHSDTVTSSEYTIPVLPNANPDTPDSEGEYTMPTVNAQQNIEEQSSFQRIL